MYDIDCRDCEECRRIINLLLQMKDELGLVEVAESASYGVHAVARRMPWHTILECQVRMSILTKTEMDTNNKENNRVVFHGPIDAETTPLLDEALFTESLSDEEAAAEYLRLKEREAQGLEEVPTGAKKSNKHYRPWEETVAALQCCSSSTQKEPSLLCTYDPEARYNGVLYADIIAKYWELFNDGKEPSEGDRNVLTFELAVTIRSICGYSLEKLMQVVPNYWAKSTQKEPSLLCRGQCKRFCIRRILKSWFPVEANDDFIWEVCNLCDQAGWDELQAPSLYPRKHRELLRAIVAVKTGISFYKVDLKTLDAAYSIAYPHSTPINVSKKKVAGKVGKPTNSHTVLPAVGA